MEAEMFYSFLTSKDYISTPKTSSYYPLPIDETKLRALTSLKNHKEAERRRRERINSHFNNLRTLLSSTSKIDKATLLAKVIQQVKELKQQTLEISETLPSEIDDISVHHHFRLFSNVSNDGGRIIFKVSFCCDDRSDLLQDLVEILKSLKMETLGAEISTIAGRIRYVLIVTVKEENGVESVQFLQNALKSLIERSSKSLMERVFSGEKAEIIFGAHGKSWHEFIRTVCYLHNKSRYDKIRESFLLKCGNLTRIYIWTF